MAVWAGIQLEPLVMPPQSSMSGVEDDQQGFRIVVFCNMLIYRPIEGCLRVLDVVQGDL
jgi:hypothetical protein